MNKSVVDRAVSNINKKLRILREALFEATKDGVQSASVSSGGSSQSYTRMSLQEIRQSIADLENAKQQLLNHGKRKGIAPDFRYPI